MTSRFLFLAGLSAFAALGCARATFHDIDGGAGGKGGEVAGVGGRGGGTGGDDQGGKGGGAGEVIGGNGGGGAGGTAGSVGLAGRGGSSGSSGVGGGGSGGGGVGGGTGGVAGRGGSSGTGGVAGMGGVAGTGGRGGTGGVSGMGGSAGTGGVSGMGGSAGGRGGTGGGPAGMMPMAVGQIVITELMHNTNTINDDSGEWIEVYNPSTTVTYDLFGCEITDTSPPGNVIDKNVVLAPMAFKTLAVSAAPGFTPDYVYTPVGAAMPVVKFDNQGGDGARIYCGGMVIDEFTYPTAAAPGSGHSFSVDPDHYNAVDNDSMANWCIARDTMNGDAYEMSGPNYGTPGRANTQCP
jgi:hypothetical protein